FRTEGAAISYTYLLWFSTALAAICLGIPLVKLRVLGPRERFSAHDGVWVCVTTFAAAGLLTVIAMDVYVFRYDFRRVTDDRRRDADEVSVLRPGVVERRRWHAASQVEHDENRYAFPQHQGREAASLPGAGALVAARGFGVAGSDERHQRLPVAEHG